MNVIQLSNVSAVIADTTSNNRVCFASTQEACCCFYSNMSLLDATNKQYKEELESLIDSGRYDTADNFTVVLQPFQTSIVFNEVNGQRDLSHFAIDCFHLSAEGNRNFALGLWNNMLQRKGEKSKVLSLPVNEIACPTDENPYFYTAQNSSKMIIIANYYYRIS